MEERRFGSSCRPVSETGCLLEPWIMCTAAELDLRLREDCGQGIGKGFEALDRRAQDVFHTPILQPTRPLPGQPRAQSPHAVPRHLDLGLFLTRFSGVCDRSYSSRSHPAAPHAFRTRGEK